MDIENQSGPVNSQEGQADNTAPEPVSGQPQTTESQTQPGQAQSTQATAAEQFFADFNSLPEDVKTKLEPFYKQMQADYTRKTQRLSKKEKEYLQKVQAYDQFTANPLHNLAQLAQQYGYEMMPRGTQPQQQQEKRTVTPDWQPNTWEDVFGKNEEYLTPKIKAMIDEAREQDRQEIEFLKKELGGQRAEKVKQIFDSIDPEWQKYEDDMREILMEHPTLAKDPAKLYRMVLPDEVLKARATQEALKQMEAKTQAAKIESSGRSKQSAPAKQGPMSFQEAFELAKTQIGRK